MKEQQLSKLYVNCYGHLLYGPDEPSSVVKALRVWRPFASNVLKVVFINPFQAVCPYERLATDGDDQLFE